VLCRATGCLASSGKVPRTLLAVFSLLNHAQVGVLLRHRSPDLPDRVISEG